MIDWNYVRKILWSIAYYAISTRRFFKLKCGSKWIGKKWTYNVNSVNILPRVTASSHDTFFIILRPKAKLLAWNKLFRTTQRVSVPTTHKATIYSFGLPYDALLNFFFIHIGLNFSMQYSILLLISSKLILFFMELWNAVFADYLFAACWKRFLRHADVDIRRFWIIERELRAIYDHKLSNMQVTKVFILFQDLHMRC